jgi:Tol biopolymer transport system component
MSSSCISTNGRFIAFASSAANLTPNDTNGNQDIFVRDLLTGTNILVSADTNGVSGNGYSLEPSISGDGRYVAFVSWATNLVAGDANQVRDVFLRDLLTGHTTPISTGTFIVGVTGNFESYSPTISSDGRYVLFWSKANNLASGSFGNGTIENLFLRDVQTATTYPLTTASSGTGVSFASMTPDGHRVVFAGIVPGSTATRVAVWDSQLAARIYTNNASSPFFVAISPDGSKIVYVTGATNLNAADLAANTNWVINTGTFAYNLGLRFSVNSQLLAYAMATNGSSQGQNIFLYDFQTGTNSLVSKGWAFNPTNTPASSPDISADGHYVAYRSSVSNSVLPDLNTVSDIFLYDRFNDATILVSVNNRGNSTANQRAFAPMFSGDGKTLVFQSWASDQFDNDFNQTSDLFALHLGLPDWLDSDGDGMNDQWEMDYFHTLDRDGTGDFDGDGVSDLLEFEAGTNPTNPASVFRADIESPEYPGVGAAISWPAAAWKSYRVQFKTNLNDAIWQDLNGDISVINNKAKITDPSADGQRFYRILLNN